MYEVLEERGFEVRLVDARQVKNVSGCKTDVLDCQWIQQLHTYGLLNVAFRPMEEICVLRSYIRQRAMLIENAAMHMQHMEKALTQMNLKLQQVLSDISGETGMKIIRAIIAGERDPKQLAKHRDYRCKRSLETIESALTGNYRAEHLFALQQAVELYDVYQEKIANCDEEIKKKLEAFDTHLQLTEYSPSSKRRAKNVPVFDLEKELQRLTGVNLLDVPGIHSLTALSLIGEIGLDMTRWKSAKQFASWLGLCPNTKISGGKRLSGKTKPSAN